MNQYRCETCKYRWNLPKGNLCPFQKEEVYYKLKEEVFIPSGTDLFTSIVGCASHSDYQSERDKVLDELDKRCDDWISQIKEIDIDGYSDPTAVEKIDLLQYIKGELEELRAGE